MRIAKKTGLLTSAAGWGVAGVLAVLVAGGVAGAATGTDPASTGARPSAAAADGAKGAASRLQGFGPRVEHGSAVVRTKQGGTRSVLVQRGEITHLANHVLTVRSADGWTAVWRLDDKTRIRSGGAKGGVGDLAVGDKVGVAGTGSGHAGTARVVREHAEGKAALPMDGVAEDSLAG